jgi:hypothetical protein
LRAKKWKYFFGGSEYVVRILVSSFKNCGKMNAAEKKEGSYYPLIKEWG